MTIRTWKHWLAITVALTLGALAIFAAQPDQPQALQHEPEKKQSGEAKQISELAPINATPETISLKRLSHTPNRRAQQILHKAQQAHGKQQWERSIALLKEAGSLDESYFDVWANLGALHLQLRRYEEARLYLEKAFALDPEDGRNLINLGGYWATRGDLHTAKRYLRQGLQNAPDSAFGRRLLNLVEQELAGS